MSHPEAAEDIHPPMFDTTVPIQMTANVLCRKGRKKGSMGSGRFRLWGACRL
jgi:hypothetical protein